MHLDMWHILSDIVFCQYLCFYCVWLCSVSDF